MRLETAGLTTTLQNVRPGLSNLKALAVSGPDLAVVAGTVVLAVYLVLLPLVARTWRTTGDEPHYLLAAHSLVNDVDFDLTNNYAGLDYLNFYYSKDIVPQTRLNAAGQQILNHHPGLPLLIAPAYALGGRFGVLLFQALVGGLLAAVSFKLAYAISHRAGASLLATLFVFLSPPLLMYHYLIYPELVAALLVTSILYFALTQDKPGRIALLLVVISLMFLPWLNRRFVPLALILALVVMWSWRKRGHWTGLFTPAGLISLAGVGLSIGLIIWFNSRLAAPLRPDFAPPADLFAVINRFVRGVAGWLFDQQRGLLIFAPVYMLALWGLPALMAAGLKQHTRHWLILLPFAASLGLASLAGGFWVAWELGPRFLVVALPALTPLLALAWRNYGHKKIFAGTAIILFGISLANSWVIIKYPEIPYKSSLPLFYGDNLGLPLTDVLPDMAEYAVFPSRQGGGAFNKSETIAGEAVWVTPAGRGLTLIETEPLEDLPAGHYRLIWQLRTQPHLPPDTELARVSINYLGGGPLFSRPITAADLPSDGSYGTFEHNFFNPNADRWRTPMMLNVATTGQADVWAEELWLAPRPSYAYTLPYLLLAVCAGGAVVLFKSIKLKPNTETPSRAPSRLGKRWWAAVLILVVISVGYLFYARGQPGQLYNAAQLGHLTGHAIADSAAQNGRAWRVDPATDPPQKAIYGPFDIYNAGQYQVIYRLKLPEPTRATQEIARLQVNATANFDELITQPILPEHFSQPNLYHDMVLTINNPRRQALSFDLHYLAVAPLVIDTVTIRPVTDNP